MEIRELLELEERLEEFIKEKRKVVSEGVYVSMRLTVLEIQKELRNKLISTQEYLTKE